MALITLFSQVAPILGGIEFDAILEDTLEINAELTTYPIESGARAADHRIILPYRWSLIGMMSNNPLKASVGSFAAGLLSNLTDNALLGAAAGYSAALLAGSEDTRSSTALKELINLMVLGTPFAINAGDIALNNMVIESIVRTKTPLNENGLEFQVQLQELPTLDTLKSRLLAPNQDQLQDGDPAKNQAAAGVDIGEKVLANPTPSQSAAVAAVL